MSPAVRGTFSPDKSHQFQPMNTLPKHGIISCNTCFPGCTETEFDQTRQGDGNWRITANPLAWGCQTPEVVVLGFSKGPMQAGALAATSHDEIAFKGGRTQLGKILRHIGLLGSVANADLSKTVSSLIADRAGRFHFGSLVRCTVEQHTSKGWSGTGGGMLDKFVATTFGQQVVSRCSKRFLGQLPPTTKLVVMLGLGTKLNYVKACFDIHAKAQGGNWHWINEIAYTNGAVTVVHVEHFKALGALLPNWLSENGHPRGKYGLLARHAVAHALEE